MEQMDTEVVETVAGVVRFLRRAAELAWIEADEDAPRSSHQLLALRIDSAGGRRWHNGEVSRRWNRAAIPNGSCARRRKRGTSRILC
jgi:hypothetical protein